MNANDLKPGDTIITYGVVVEILREKTDDPNQFGLPWFKFWAKRADTGAEGWLKFGPGAQVVQA